MKTFEQYLIEVGIRSVDSYNFSKELLFENIEHFRKCYKDENSPYKALLFLTL